MNTQAHNNSRSWVVPTASTGPTWLDESVYPFTSRYQEITGHRLHYIDEGSGPILLLLHGQPAWSFMYRNIVQDLCKDFRCIAIDYPGFGLSVPAPDFDFSIPAYADILEQFVLKLGLSDITLVMHDSGGAIGMGAAIRHPSRFTALVTSNTFAWSLDDYPEVLRFLRIVGSSLFGFLNVNLNLLLTAFVSFGPRKFTRAEKDAYRGPFFRHQDRRVMHLMFRSLARDQTYLREIEAGLAELAGLPLLNLWGSGDAASQAGFLEHWESLFPHHQSAIIFKGTAATGHFPQEARPEEWIRVFRSWWADQFAKQR